MNAAAVLLAPTGPPSPVAAGAQNRSRLGPVGRREVAKPLFEGVVDRPWTCLNPVPRATGRRRLVAQRTAADDLVIRHVVHDRACGTSRATSGCVFAFVCLRVLQQVGVVAP